MSNGGWLKAIIAGILLWIAISLAVIAHQPAVAGSVVATIEIVLLWSSLLSRASSFAGSCQGCSGDQMLNCLLSLPAVAGERFRRLRYEPEFRNQINAALDCPLFSFC